MLIDFSPISLTLVLRIDLMPFKPCGLRVGGLPKGLWDIILP